MSTAKFSTLNPHFCVKISLTQSQMFPFSSTCNAKLILPKDRAIWHDSARCQQPALPGKLRCGRHGGLCTGARTLEGSRQVAARMHEGRRRWIARMKTQGRPLPFAGFKPKGSGTPREARDQAKAQRAAARRGYSEQCAILETLKAKSRTIRTLIPRYIKKSDFDDPHTLAQAAAAAMLANECSKIILHVCGNTGAAAHKATLRDAAALKAVYRHWSALKPLLSFQFEYAIEMDRRRKGQEARERHERFRQMTLQALQERSGQ
jgi:hypothetical protein